MRWEVSWLCETLVRLFFVITKAPGNFSLENFDAHLCTHLVFAFALLREDGNIYADADNTGNNNTTNVLL